MINYSRSIPNFSFTQSSPGKEVEEAFFWARGCIPSFINRYLNKVSLVTGNHKGGIIWHPVAFQPKLGG
jgi:hypothetical protein